MYWGFTVIGALDLLHCFKDVGNVAGADPGGVNRVTSHPPLKINLLLQKTFHCFLDLTFPPHSIEKSPYFP